MGELLVYVPATVAGMLPRDVLAGSDTTLTLVGEHLRRDTGDNQLGGGGGDEWGGYWCLFGDAPPTPARAVSSAVAVCELPPAGGERARALKLTSGRRRVDLAPTPGAGVLGPCAAAAAGCVALRYWPVVATVTAASPASVPEGGGARVTVAGRGFPDVPALGCRFGTTGPVTAQWGSFTRVECHSPAKAPSTVLVAVLGAWGVEPEMRGEGVQAMGRAGGRGIGKPKP